MSASRRSRRLHPTTAVLVASAIVVAACGHPRTPVPRTSADYCGRIERLARDGVVEQRDCGITRGPKTEKKIALVFTAGSFCEGGPTFLDALSEHGAKASFFLLSEATRGDSVSCSAVVPRIIGEGHYVGLHSDTHPDIVDGQGGRTTITRQAFDAELRNNLAALRAKGVTGPVRYWMPPSETFNDEISAWSADRGLVTVHLTECPETQGDYLPAGARGGKFANNAIVSRVLSCHAKDPHNLNGAILFFHLGIGKNREDKDKFHHAFPALMKRLVAEGYSFVRIDDMLGASAGRALTVREGDPDYERMTPEAVLQAKYERMAPFTRNRVEREVLDVAYRALALGRRHGRWLDVNLEDLMAHARQESGNVIDALAERSDIKRLHSVGTSVWDFHQLPSSDLSGFVSFSVWQTITPNYFFFGPDLSPKLADLHARYIEPYRLTEKEEQATPPPCGTYAPSKDEKDAFEFAKKIAKLEPRPKAKQQLDRMIDELTAILSGDPTLHAEVIAALVEANYRRSGVRSPDAVRAYFWSAIQTNLDPAKWLEPVRYDDDVPPLAESGCTDNNVVKRGDYGKQVVLGNTYNDRGMVYWYAVTRDRAALDRMIAAWASQPARLTKADYAMLRERGHLGYVRHDPEIYDYVIERLPAK